MNISDNVSMAHNDTWRSVPIKFISTFDPWEDHIIGIFMVIIGMISVGGNGISVRVFCQRFKEITSTEIFLLNIALVNLLLAIASYPAFIVSSFYHQWIFGEIGCAVYGASCYFLGLATILSLAVLAVFRYIKICFAPRGHVNSTQTIVVLVGVYLYSAIWSLIPFFGIAGYDVEPFGLSCTLDWKTTHPNGRWYIISLCVFCIFLPALVIFGSHLAVFFQIRRMRSVQHCTRISRQSLKAETQFFRVSFGVCFGFLFAWFPYTCLALYSIFGDSSHIPMWLTAVPVLMAKSSIAYNPIIYVVITKSYRNDFIQVARDMFHLPGCKNEE